MMKRSKLEYLIWLVVGCSGLTLFLNYQPKVDPLSKVVISIGRKEAVTKSEVYLLSQGFDLSELASLHRAVRFLPSQVQQRAYQMLDFSEQDIQFLEGQSPAYYWSVSWFNDNGQQIYNVVVGPDGEPFGFDYYIPEDVPGDSLTQEQAKQIMDEFLLTKMRIDLDNYELLEISSDRQRSRMDYFLNYYSKYDFPGEIQLRLRTAIRGSRVAHVTTFFHLPERLLNDSIEEIQNGNIIGFVVVPSIMLGIFIILSVLYILRFHAGEIAIKAPIVVGLFYTFVIILIAINSFDTWSIFGLNNASPGIRMVAYLAIYTFIGVLGAVMILLSWSVGDSLVREKWGYKLTLFDKISSGRIFFPALLPSVYIGYMAGFLAIGLWSVLTYLVTQNFSAWTEMRGALFLFTSYFPALEVSGEAVTDSLFYSFIGAVFLIAVFNKYLKPIKNQHLKTFAAIMIMALLVSFSQSLIPIYPFYWRYAITVITSFILGWIFVRYDLVAVLVAGFILSAVPYAYELFQTEQFFISGIVAYIFTFTPFVIGLIAYFKGKELTMEELATKPSYVKLIAQRERMSQELDIARNVQMSLLPKKNPLVEGYDIAGVCLPALEVGGDYYDFFQLGDGKIGIAIGDVSGKGVPAAIYMTLTKGILQTCASETGSPKEVLFKLNKQMYKSIERNSFVSMFYAVLDMTNHKIRFARAGHNPAILAHRSSDTNSLLEPKGIAVGLESGKKFYEILEEHELQLERGDVLTFYTDGFTEASTKDGEEYGEERLINLISQNKDFTANAIIQKIVRSIKAFIGNHPQHDDMTMVVVKVL